MAVSTIGIDALKHGFLPLEFEESTVDETKTHLFGKSLKLA